MTQFILRGWRQLVFQLCLLLFHHGHVLLFQLGHIVGVEGSGSFVLLLLLLNLHSSLSGCKLQSLFSFGLSLEYLRKEGVRDVEKCL